MSGELVAKYWRELVIAALLLVVGLLIREITVINDSLTKQKLATQAARINVATLQEGINAANEAKEANAKTAKLIQDDLKSKLAVLDGKNDDLERRIAEFESDGSEDLKTCTEDQAKDYGRSWQLLKAYRKGMTK